MALLIMANRIARMSALLRLVMLGCFFGKLFIVDPEFETVV
jgi:hypothetical protein